MALSAEIRAKLGLDTADFTRGLQGIPVQVEKFGADAARTLQKKFSGADLFRGVLQGIGIASVQQIAEKLIAPFRESAESARAISEWTDKAADGTERLLKLRQSDAQQLAAMEKSARRIAQEMEDLTNRPATQKFFGFIERGSAFDKLFGFSRREDAERAVQLAEKATQAAEKAVEVETKRQQIDDKAFEQIMRNERARADYVKANREQVELEAKALSGRILPLEKARLEVLIQQNKIRENEQKIGDILQKYPVERTAAEKQTLQQLFRQRDVLDKQLDQKQQIADAIKAQESAEKKVTAEIEKQNEGLRIGFQIRGQGNEALSPRELDAKERNLRAQLLITQLRDMFPTGLNLFNSQILDSQDPLKGFKQRELSALLQERRTRETIQRNAEFFGEDRAFQMAGVSESRFRQILEARGPDNSERIVTHLERLNRLFERGITVVDPSSG